MRYGWLAVAALAGLTGCREADGPLGGADAGMLVVLSDPAGGRIELDGRATGRVTPDTLRGTAGLHDVLVQLDTMQLRYRYAAQVVVPVDQPLTLNGPLMARCTATTIDCAAQFRLGYQLGNVRFAVNALGPLFLQAGAGEGLYWPASTENSYVSTATPVFGALWSGTAVSTGIYDTDFFAGRPVPSSFSSGGRFTLSQTTWILPPAAAMQFAVARGLEIRERLLTTTSEEGLFLVELKFRNITQDPLYALVDPAMTDVGGATFENAYIGLALDPDIGSVEQESDDDWASYDGEQATVYAYDAAFLVPGFTVNQNAPAMVGLRVVQRPAGTGVVLNAWTRQTASDWEGGTSTQAAGYGMLSGLQSYTPDQPGTLIGHLPVAAGDVRTVATVGPLRLAPGDSAAVVLAIALASPVAGSYTSGTVINPGNPADTARQLYAVAGLLRQRLAAAETLLPLLQ